MRTITKASLLSCFLLILGCSTENETADLQQADPNFRVYDSIRDGNETSGADTGEFCLETTLIAGQHYDAGIITVTNDGENLIITISTNGDWIIDLTHLSIGACDDIPTTGSGNPKIGKFEHSEPHEYGTNEVIYMISLDVIPENYCFAVHAEVQGPEGGETAWGEGTEFEGNSWAMFIESTLSECEGGGGPF